MSPVDDESFITQTLAAIRAESSAAQDARFEDALRALPRPPGAPRRARRPLLGYALTAIAAGFIGAAIAFAASRTSDASPRDDAFALDGGTGAARTASPISITSDSQGRPTEIARRVGGRLEGERVLFRAGQVIRIEHYRDGLLDGPQLDFDGLGRLVAMRTYTNGVERGPFVELAPDGIVKASGIR